LFSLATANAQFGVTNVRVFHKKSISHAFLPGIGGIGGSTDYYVSNIAETVSAETLAKYPDMVHAGESCFVVLEAKRSETVSTKGARAQIFARLLTLKLDETQYLSHLSAWFGVSRLRKLNGHTVVLTDGDSWWFFFVQKQGNGEIIFTMKEYTADRGDKDKLIIGTKISYSGI
jgi:hypothetical protein